MNRKFFLIASSAAILYSALSSASVFAQSIAAVLTIDPTAVMTNDRLILTVTGTYTCGPFPPSDYEKYAFMNVMVRQVSGRDIAEAGTYISSSSPTSPLLCDGNMKIFQAPLIVGVHPFHGGKARADGSITVETCVPEEGCQSTQGAANAQIKIQGGGQ